MDWNLDWHEIQELREKYDKLVGEAGEILDKADRGKHELTVEEAKTFDRLHREARQVKAKIACEENKRPLEGEKPKVGIVTYDNPTGDRYANQDGREVRVLRKNESFRSAVCNDMPDGIQPHEISLGAIVRGIATGDWRGADAEKRALSSGGSAGFLLPTPISGEIIDLARARSRVMEAGSRVIPMDTGELTIVKVLTDPTAAWKPEGQKIVESNPTFGKVVLHSYTLAALVKAPLELISDARNLEETIRQILAAALGLAMDKSFLYGTGSGQPIGLKTAVGEAGSTIGKITHDAILANYDPFSSAVQLIQEANHEPNALLLSPRSVGELDRLKTATELQPLTPPASFAALTKLPTSQVKNDEGGGTDSSGFLGQWDKHLVGIRQNILIQATNQAGDSFEKMQVFIRAFLRTDNAWSMPGAFAVIEGIQKT